MHVVVVGGGTAGWITALMAREMLSPNARITLVESEEIGILGAGEGTTPHFVNLFCDRVGISMQELVQETGATFKNSIRFVDWNGPGTSYMHPFEDQVTPGLQLTMVHPEEPLPNKDVSFSCHASSMGRLLLRPGGEPGPGALGGMKMLGAWAVHFDARRLATYLRKVGTQRGIERVEGTVKSVVVNPDGSLDALVFRDGRQLGLDFVFDCTGMRRLLIGKHFGVPLVDVQQTLPVNKALPFSLPLDGPREPFTEAIAMQAGWVWKIPVQGRYGCGYVYDDRFATEDEARAHVRSRFGDVDMPRVLSFQAGYLEKIWVKNCCAIGLASGFLEPLEATSIWASIITLDEFLRVHFPVADDHAHDELNAFHRRLNGRIVDFLYLHYLGGRSDTPFWRTFRERTVAPPMSRAILERGGLRWPFDEDPLNAGHPAPFPSISWVWVAKGLGLLEQSSMRRYWDYYDFGSGYTERLAEHTRKLRKVARRCVPHEDMLRAMGG